MTEQVEVIIAGLVLIFTVATAILDRRRAARFNRIRHTEKTRAEWAEARELLFDLVRAGKLDPRSETVRSLYGVQTFVLRRPDAYQQIARQLQKGLLTADDSPEPAWVSERDTWPAGMASVFKKMASGTRMLAFGYPGFLGQVVKTLWAYFPEILAGLAARSADSILGDFGGARGVRIEREFYKAEKKFQSLATPMLAA
jgi:hypothetical protein